MPELQDRTEGLRFIPPIRTPAVSFGQESAESAGLLVAAAQLDGRLGPGLVRTVESAWEMMRAACGVVAREWRVLSMSTGSWCSVPVDDDATAAMVPFGPDVVGAVARFGHASLVFQAIRTVATVVGGRLGLQVVDKPTNAHRIGRRFEAWALPLVASGAIECGFVNVGGWANPVADLNDMPFIPTTWAEVSAWAPGYVWAVYLTDEAAARCGLTGSRHEVAGPNHVTGSEDVVGNGVATVTRGPTVKVQRLASGSWRLTTVPPDQPGHDEGLLRMRELLWPALRLVSPALGSNTTPKLWEGGTIGVAAHYLDDPALVPGKTFLRINDGARMCVRLKVPAGPDAGTVTDVRWTVDAWRRFGYAYRDASLADIAFADWLIPEVTVVAGEIYVTVRRTDHRWAQMLIGVLNERRCLEARNGTTPIIDVQPVDGA